MILAALLATTLVTHQNTDPKVTYTTSAIPISRALAELSKLSGKHLTATPDAANNVLIIDVREVSLSALVQKIAVVTSCQWKTEQNGDLTLEKDSALWIREAQAERQKKIDTIKKTIAKMVDSLKPKANSKADANSTGLPATFGFFGMGGGGAVQKALIRLAALLDVGFLADLQEGDRIVFSTNPNRMQRPIGGNATTILTDLVREHNIGVANRKSTGKEVEAGLEELGAEMSKLIQDFMPQSYENPIPGSLAKALVVVSHDSGGVMSFAGMGDSIKLHLTMYDANGKVVLAGDLPIQDFSAFEAMVSTDEEDPQNDVSTKKKEKPAKNSKVPTVQTGTIKLSPETIEVQKLMTGFGNQVEMPSGPILQKLLRPDIYDPLSFEKSDVVLAVSKDKKTQLVANVPDSDGNKLSRIMRNSEVTTLEKAWTSLTKDHGTIAEIADGWLTIRPESPNLARRERIDRVALAQLINASYTKGIASLDDLAAFAQRCPSPTESDITMPYIMVFAPNVLMNGMFGFQDWDMVRFYGSLSVAQKLNLLNGGRIPLVGLVPNQTQVVQKLTYGSGAKLLVDRPGQKAPAAGGGGFMDMMLAFMPSKSVDYLDEPTEVMPNGIPPNGSVTMIQTSESFAMPVGKDGSLSSRMGALGVDELAMISMSRNDPNMAGMEDGMAALEKLRLGERKKLAFTFRLTPQVRIERTLTDQSISKTGAVYSISGLPKSFQAQIDKRVADIKKSPFGSMMGAIGQRGSPPPPPSH